MCHRRRWRRRHACCFRPGGVGARSGACLASHDAREGAPGFRATLAGHPQFCLTVPYPKYRPSRRLSDGQTSLLPISGGRRAVVHNHASVRVARCVEAAHRGGFLDVEFRTGAALRAAKGRVLTPMSEVLSAAGAAVLHETFWQWHVHSHTTVTPKR